MINKIIFGLIVIAIISGVTLTLYKWPEPEVGPYACTMEAKMCPDGSAVGRSGPNCEFAACPVVEEEKVPADVQAHIDAKANLIKVTAPLPLAKITSPLSISGEARGYWFFEASFPIGLVNWDGVLIAEGVATADGEWMTEDFVPYTATLTFTNPYQPGDPAFMKNGALIMKKDNPSGLPQNDDALEIPVRF